MTTKDQFMINFMAKNWRGGGTARQPYNFSILMYQLLQECGIDVYRTGECKLIVGSRKKLWDEVGAELVAVRPGIIICNVLSEGAGAYCTGTLERQGESYDVKTFASINDERLHGYASINIGPGPVNHRDAAAVFHWSYGRNEGSSLGLAAEHWAILRPWIEHWLGDVARSTP